MTSALTKTLRDMRDKIPLALAVVLSFAPLVVVIALGTRT